MKYSDQQRIQKIYEKAVKLQVYCGQSDKERGFADRNIFAMACYNAII